MSQEEKTTLADAVPTGSLEAVGSSYQDDTVDRHVIIVMYKQVTGKVELEKPRSGFVIHVQQNDGWMTVPSDRHLSSDFVYLIPSHVNPRDTTYWANLPSGAASGGLAIAWE